jgi:toxin ParE1/3/4
MTHRIKIRPKASIDTDDCFAYIVQNNEDSALRFFDAVRQTFADLARMPRVGKRYRHSAKPDLQLHQWPVRGFRAYLIFYRISETEIEIVRILPASRNLDQILANESN